MSDLDDFLRRAELYARASGLTLTTVSGKLFDNGSRLASLKDGADIGVRRLERAWLKLKEMEREAERSAPRKPVKKGKRSRAELERCA